VKDLGTARFILIFALCAYFVSVPVRARQQVPPSSASPASLTSVLAPLARQIAGNAGEIGCHSGKCRILVTNFVYPGKGSPPFAVQLADALAIQLSQGEKSFAVVDRPSFRNLLDEERFSPEGQESAATARWLARKLNADAVIVGELANLGDNSLEVSAQLINVGDLHRKALSVKGRLQVDLSHVDLSSSDGLSPVPALGNTIDGQDVYHYRPGMSLPSCYYMPNPPYSEEARREHVSGTILVEAIVWTDGHLKNLRIIRGLPGGLNENALKTLATWGCRPARYDGKPVSMLTVFEVNFKLNQ